MVKTYQGKKPLHYLGEAEVAILNGRYAIQARRERGGGKIVFEPFEPLMGGSAIHILDETGETQAIMGPLDHDAALAMRKLVEKRDAMNDEMAAEKFSGRCADQWGKE